MRLLIGQQLVMQTVTVKLVAGAKTFSEIERVCSNQQEHKLSGLWYAKVRLCNILYTSNCKITMFCVEVEQTCPPNKISTRILIHFM